LHWSEEELGELRRVYPWLAGAVERQRAAWVALWAGLRKTRAAREDLSEEEFVWALESVLSRAFRGTVGSSE
jgi:hypothetical protein